METQKFRRHALVPKIPLGKKRTPFFPVYPGGHLGFALGQLSKAERRAMRQIAENADLVMVDHKTFLVAKITAATAHALAAFEAEMEDRENDLDDEGEEDDDRENDNPADADGLLDDREEDDPKEDDDPKEEADHGIADKDAFDLETKPEGEDIIATAWDRDHVAATHARVHRERLYQDPTSSPGVYTVIHEMDRTHDDAESLKAAQFIKRAG